VEVEYNEGGEDVLKGFNAKATEWAIRLGEK
jgi:hypothetical protein